MLKHFTMLLVAVMTFLVSAKGESWNYEQLNSILENMNATIDTSGIGVVEREAIGYQVTFTFYDTALCNRFSVGDLDISISEKMTEEVDGELLEKYEVAISGSSLTVECKIQLCFMTDAFLDTEDCGGYLSIYSNNTSINLVQQVYSRDFSQFPPNFANMKKQECNETLSMDGVTFGGKDIGSHFFAGDLTGQVLDALNGEAKEEAVAAITAPLCDMFPNLTAGLSNMIVNNSLTNLTQAHSDLYQDALALEEAVAASVSDPDVKFWDLADNFLMNALFPGVSETRSLMLDVENELVKTVAAYFDIALPPPGTNLYYHLLDTYLGTNLIETNGALDNFDVLKAVANFFPGPLEIDYNLTQLQVVQGSLFASVESLLLSTTPVPGSELNPFEFTFPGPQTVFAPTLALGNIKLEAKFKLKVDAQTDILKDMNLTLDTVLISLDETFDGTFDWNEFVANVSLLVAVDENRIPSIQLGPLVKALMACITSVFFKVPTVSSAGVFADGIGLGLTGFVDAIIGILGKLVEAAVAMFQGVIPGGLRTLMFSYLVGTELLEEQTCPTIQLDETTSQLYNLEQSQLFKYLKDYIDGLDVKATLQSILKEFVGEDVQPDEPLVIFQERSKLFNLTIPQAKGTQNISLEVNLESLSVFGVLPPEINEITLLEFRKDSAFYPHALFNELWAATAQNPIGVAVVVDLELFTEPEAGAKRRQLFEAQKNKVKLDVGFGSVKGAFELFLALSMFAIEGLRLDEMIDFAALDFSLDVFNMIRPELLNVDCWVGKLQPYGGIKNLLATLAEFELGIKCLSCDNKDLQVLSERFDGSDMANSLEGYLEHFIGSFVSMVTSLVNDQFNQGKWEATVTAAKERCSAGDTAEGNLLTYVLNEMQKEISLERMFVDQNFTIPELEEDLSQGYAFVGMFFSVIGLAGLCTFGCSCTDQRTAKLRQTVTAVQVDPENPAAEELDEQLQKKGTGLVGKERAIAPVVEDLTSTPLFRHPSVPRCARIVIPIILVANFGLFVFGHVAPVMITDVTGSFLDVTFAVEDFATLSVIQTTKKLWEAEAFFLAIMLAGFSVVWPYIKLVGVCLCWFLPTSRLSFQRRGKIITILDQLGKWSLVELYFVAFVFVVLNLEVLSPEGHSVLPESLYAIRLEIQPQPNLYTFTVALLLSLFISNLLVAYQEKIHSQITEAKRGASGMLESDHATIRIIDFLFEHVAPSGARYRVSLSWFGAGLVLLSTLASIALILAASALTVLKLDFHGLARNLMEFAKSPTELNVDLYWAVGDLFTDASVGEIFFGLAFVLTVLIIPVFQLLMLVVIPFKSFSLQGAARFLEWNQILSAWSATEVFVLAIGVAAIEIKTVSKFIIGDSCTVVGSFMQQAMLPLDLVEVEDVEATCLGITATVEIGAYVFFAALILSNLTHLFIVKLFQEYVYNRKEVTAPHFDQDSLGNDGDATEQDEPNLTPSLRFLRAVRLVHVRRDTSAVGVPTGFITPTSS